MSRGQGPSHAREATIGTTGASGATGPTGPTGATGPTGTLPTLIAHQAHSTATDVSGLVVDFNDFLDKAITAGHMAGS